MGVSTQAIEYGDTRQGALSREHSSLQEWINIIVNRST
jgi:hypothetical protein